MEKSIAEESHASAAECGDLQASALQKMFRELASERQDTARRLNFRGRMGYGGEDTAGADRRQRQGDLVGSFPPAGVAGELGRRIDGGLHHQSRQRRGSAPGLGCAVGL
jgi:hypothetical protein